MPRKASRLRARLGSIRNATRFFEPETLWGWIAAHPTRLKNQAVNSGCPNRAADVLGRVVGDPMSDLVELISRPQIVLHRAIAHVSCIRLIPSSLRAFSAPAADTLNASQFHEIEKTCEGLGRLVLGLGCRSYRSPDSARSRQRRTSRSIPLVRSFQFLADSPVPAQPPAHPLTN